jgi:quinolinate synthase
MVRNNIVEEIKSQLKSSNGILLAHNYQRPEIQDIADLTGDSLELSIKAAETDADLIVFCGVHFMAETASIVSPDKTVLIPRLDAGCPMADMITPEALEARLIELGDVPVVTYVNSPASVKAHSTICCTSANAVAVVNGLEESEILMTPDRNLCHYAAAQSSKKIHCWHGCCPIHDQLTPAEVKKARAAHPEALFMAHPECRPEVLALADAVKSTSGMLAFAGRSDRKAFIVGTEEGLIYPLRKANPEKSFHKVSESMVCPDMKRTRLEDVLTALTEMTYEVKVPEEIRLPASLAVKRMLVMTAPRRP